MQLDLGRVSFVPTKEQCGLLPPRDQSPKHSCAYVVLWYEYVLVSKVDNNHLTPGELSYS